MKRSARYNFRPSPSRANGKAPTAGRLVAFEGLDASGKSTQIRLLLDVLRDSDVQHEYVSFPRTDQRGYGEAIAMFLRGEFGAVEEVSPYLVASLFAGDRVTFKPTLEAWLHGEKLVLADRYFYSNVAFQGAKLRSPDAKRHFRSWIRQIEFVDHQIPVPDVTVFFDVPLDFVKTTIAIHRPHEERSYLNGQADIHEFAFDLQERVAAEYRALALQEQSFHTVSCSTATGQMRSPREIHEEVLEILVSSDLLAEVSWA